MIRSTRDLSQWTKRPWFAHVLLMLPVPWPIHTSIPIPTSPVMIAIRLSSFPLQATELKMALGQADGEVEIPMSRVTWSFFMLTALTGAKRVVIRMSTETTPMPTRRKDSITLQGIKWATAMPFQGNCFMSKTERSISASSSRPRRMTTTLIQEEVTFAMLTCKP